MSEITYYGLDGSGCRMYKSGVSKPIDDVQMFFYSDGTVSGSFVFDDEDGLDRWWLFANALFHNGTLYFEMVRGALRYTPEPSAIFIGKYDGEGTFAGTWTSDTEEGGWHILLRKQVGEASVATGRTSGIADALRRRWGVNDNSQTF